ncbi:hypothetical protein [Nostoc sp. LEGE 12450]|nr:hypothetical protein [Nostoc sp. LEGE 12450]
MVILGKKAAEAIAPNKTDIVNRTGMRRRSQPQASFLRSPR